MTIRVWVYVLSMALLSLVLAPALMASNDMLRVLLNLLVFGGVAALIFSDAASRAQKEVAHARLLAGRVRDGLELDDRDIERCFHPMRGVLAALVAVAPFLAVTIPLAVLAEPYVYVLQDLPSWLNSFGRADIGDALAYYAVRSPVSAVDYLRFAVRLILMPAAYIFGGFGDAASLLQDRLSPLLALVLPAAYAIGYLRGPALDRKVLARNEEAKRLHLKKIARKKKRERQRVQGPKGPERLI